jgi:ABC-type multidrug transport system fused ATPase/permease subunit
LDQFKGHFFKFNACPVAKEQRTHFFLMFLALVFKMTNKLSFVAEHPALYVLFCTVWMALVRHFFVYIYSLLGQRILPTISQRSKTKFAESLFFCSYYTFTFSMGFLLTYNQPYFWDTKYYFIGFPHTNTESTAFYLFYLFQMGYYISALLYELNIVRNERVGHTDHYIMILHHTVTITLIWFSYAIGYTRIGAIVFILHDCSDIILELSKATHYVKLTIFGSPAKNFLFPVFAFTFFITRLVLYPLRVLVPAYFEVTQVIPDAPYVMLFNVFLWTLEAMHLFWFYLILRIVYRALAVKQLGGDIRSDDEENEEIEKKLKMKKRSCPMEEPQEENNDHLATQNGHATPKKTKKTSVRKDD